MSRQESSSIVALLALFSVGCSDGAVGDMPNNGAQSGGSSSQGTTGATTTGFGGSVASTGGAQSRGGTVSSTTTTVGGSSGAGGTVRSNGGSVASGGASPIGGAAQSGSATTGGTQARGGTASGGTTPTGAGGSTSRGGTGAGGTTSAGNAAVGGTSSLGGATSPGGSVNGGTTATGGSGTGGSAGCTAEPVTPNATANTRKVLCYLYSQHGNHILSGQEENNDDAGMTYIFQNTGKYPAVRAFDVNNSRAPTQCVDHWKKGGLCMFGYHMGITPSDGYTGSQTKTDINTLLTEGSAFNTTFKARLDKVAAMIKTVQDADGVAIMRLFHEAGRSCAWFWWGMEGGAQFIKIHKYAFNYLTATKSLRNMIWMVPLCGTPDPAYNPGKAFFDLGGADSYAGDGNYGPLTSLFNQTVAAFPSVPIALHENGPIPDPDQLKSTGTKWLLFNTWTSPFYQSPSNSVAHLQKVYTHDYVITLDEMPGW